MISFIPRTVFPVLDSLPRSYYLGHHAAGLSKMRKMINQIDLIIECRDYRVPLTSHNPLFEEALSGKKRLIVYTKKDLGRDTTLPFEIKKRETRLERWHNPVPVLFSDHRSDSDVKRILKQIETASEARGALTGSFLLVVGMPNVGKSSLLNALRRVGVGKGKAAKTGAQPGITRAIARSGVKIVSSEEDSGNVYLVDTPGVFMPYVPDADSMLKLALCGSVKDTIIPPTTLADYLLFHINKHDPQAYSAYHKPTNEIIPVLEEMARKTGRLGKTAAPDTEAAALWFIQKWREGLFGKFILDDVSKSSLEGARDGRLETQMSVNQAKRAAKDLVRDKAIARKQSKAL